MIQRTFAVLTLATLVLLLSANTRLFSAEKRPAETAKIFSGEPRLVIVNGYSTSYLWPAVLQRKLDKYFDGKRVIEVKSATKGGTPIAKWMDARAGRPLSPWTERLLPALKDKGNRPAIVLAQQSLQWAYGQRQAGIRNSNDTERIEAGAEVIHKYANLLIKSGADEVFIAMHIYKKPMEPVIGNERFALAEYMKSRPQHVHPGPDVWEPTSKVWPQAFRADKVHPNEMGAEIMAHHWFEALLKHDGREVPEWSRQEMLAAMKKNSTHDQQPQPSRRAQAQRPTGGGRDMSFAGLSSRHDRNKDGKITKDEFRAPQRVFQQLDKNKDGVLTKDDFAKPAND